ncbi:MAG: lipid II flippase MurJ, partial [Planctomycetota bacterium]
RGPRVRELWHQSLPFVAIMVVVTLYGRLDVLVLYPVWGEDEVGVYSASLRVVNVFVIAIQCFVAALYPLLSKSFNETHTELLAFTRRALKHVLLVTIPVSATVSILAREIATLLFGGEHFEVSGEVLALQAWLPVPYAVTVIQAYSLLARGRQRVDLAVNVIGTVVLAILTLLLIPRFGAMGTAVATLAATVIYLCVQTPLAGVLHWPHRRQWPRIASVALATILLAALGYLTPISAPLRALAALTGYILLMVLLRPLDTSDLDIVRSLLRRRALP